MLWISQPFHEAVRMKDMSTYIRTAPRDSVANMKCIQANATSRGVRVCAMDRVLVLS